LDWAQLILRASLRYGQIMRKNQSRIRAPSLCSLLYRRGDGCDCGPARLESLRIAQRGTDVPSKDSIRRPEPTGVTKTMLITKSPRPAFRSVQGWARSILLEAGAIRECEDHGWAKVRSDPDAWEYALPAARKDPPAGVSPEQAVAVVEDVLCSIGDTCPECET